MDDLFLKIISGEIPAEKIYEDEHVFAFLDINPVNPGHTLVVPKEYSRNLLDISDDALIYLILATKKVAIAVKEATGAAGINIHMNNEPTAGQVIFHTHIHILPRFENDGRKLWKGKPYKDDEEQRIGELIRKKIV